VLSIRHFLIYLCFIATNLAASDLQAVKRVHAHLLLDDTTSALQEVNKHLVLYPDSKQLREAHVEVMAQMRDEKGMYRTWEALIAQFPEEKKNRLLLENIAWGTLNTALHSTSPATRLMGALGAFFANDAKSVKVLQNCMRDSNALIRAMAVHLASQMRDSLLCDEVMRLFQTENTFIVRLEVINALGAMKIMSSRPGLEAIIASSQSSAEEKAAAIQSIVALIETTDREEIIKLATSNRAGLRLLACAAIAHFDLHRDLDFVIPLLKDSNAEVRAAALNVLGYLRVAEYCGKPIIEYVAPLEEDHDYHVAINAAWVIALNDAADGQCRFKRWLRHDLRDVRLFAAATLTSLGKYAVPLISEAFHSTDDPYVRMNLAMGMISQRIEPQKACQALADGLSGISENWMWEQIGALRILKPSTAKQSSLVTENPKEINQLTRLEILNILAVMKYPKTQETLKSFLKEQNWGVTWMAAALMLTEGDSEAIAIIRTLLNDTDPAVRIQSALLLSIWGRDEQAITTLQQAYKGADRECKGHILEGLGKIGEESSIPFLITVLKEPHQTLRIIAACAILQCLNH
jgi:HEAT repeat protein